MKPHQTVVFLPEGMTLVVHLIDAKGKTRRTQQLTWTGSEFSQTPVGGTVESEEVEGQQGT